MQSKSVLITNFTMNGEADFSFGCHNCSSDECRLKDIEAYLRYSGTECAFSSISIESFELVAIEEKRINVKFGSSNETATMDLLFGLILEIGGRRLILNTTANCPPHPEEEIRKWWK
ncbi:hypothetical protein COLO4_33900 [Corchorus olitorius]|uniref:Uncharacterized protein n=1 Tax=Corchorus olitorius TaxID=93759 RepID=A0A1R3GQ58_9ROSI|nr:hypothetical protein COLO4_33900 [Corchorus olitorius]